MQRVQRKKLSILIFGAGAIGGYIGAKLALHEHRIVVLERTHHAELLRKQGFYLTEGDRTHHITNIAVVTSVDEALQFVNFDLALVAVKSYDTEPLVKSIAPNSERLPPFICLQNGVENEAAIASVLGSSKVMAGTVTTAIAKEGVGRLHLERKRGIGLAGSHPLSSGLVAALKGVGLNARLYPSAASMKWSKLLTNLLCNASCAILDLTPSQVISHPKLFDLEMRQLGEALKVMRAQRINVVDLPGIPVKALALATRLPHSLARPLMARAVARGRGGKMPSLYIDLHNNKGLSEVDWLNGAVVRAGKNLGVPTPINRFLNETLTKIVNGNLAIKSFSHQPEKLLALIS